MDEAENTVRKQMKNRSGTDTFVVSARIAMYNKLFGLSPIAAYRNPTFVRKAENVDGAIDLNSLAEQHRDRYD